MYFCEEEVARGSFWAVEEIGYHIDNATASCYRLVSLVGVLMLTLGVVVLAIAKTSRQVLLDRRISVAGRRVLGCCSVASTTALRFAGFLA